LFRPKHPNIVYVVAGHVIFFAVAYLHIIAIRNFRGVGLRCPDFPGSILLVIAINVNSRVFFQFSQTVFEELIKRLGLFF
jgi:hypothetical protein